MNKNHIWALVAIGVAAVIFIVTRGSTTVNLLVTEVRAATSFVLLGFTALGVLIGALLR